MDASNVEVLDILPEIVVRQAAEPGDNYIVIRQIYIQAHINNLLTYLITNIV